VGHYGPIFRRLWTKVHQIKCACSGVVAVSVCKAVLRSTISCSSLEVWRYY